MDQTSALNALAPYLALVKSTNSEAVTSKVITDATSAPGTYLFTELLNTVQVQALRNGENNAYFLQLCRFYNGTLFEYVQDIGRCGLPPLNEAQRVKLRELSLLSYARFPHNLTYDKLKELLIIESTAELEEVVMTAIYNGVIHGRLDPHNQRVVVTSVAPLRDVPPSATAELQDILKEWSDRCTSTLGDLERQIQLIKAGAIKRKKEQDDWDAFYCDLLEDGDGKQKTGGGTPKRGVAQRTMLGKGKRGLSGWGGGGMGGGQRLGRDDDVEMGEEEDGNEDGNGQSGPRVTRSKRGKGFLGGLGKR